MKQTKSIYSILAIITFKLLLISPVVLADSMSDSPEINNFASCSKQCIQQNEVCKQKQKPKCKKNNDCFEVCNQAYPECMAKCPRPGG